MSDLAAGGGSFRLSEWSKCPVCGQSFRLGDLFCDGCGRKILYTSKQRERIKHIEMERAVQDPKPRTPAAPQTPYLLCVRCNTRNPLGAKRCIECGHKGLIVPKSNKT